MSYTKIEFKNIKDSEGDILIALLADVGFESFEECENSLNAFIKQEKYNEADFKEVISRMAVEYTISVIPQQNWNAKWESSFEPIIVEDFVAIRAGFHEPVKNVQHEIIITPKMSFGTGHHATTYMMIEQMKNLDFVNKTVVDFGTGTAVLAILAQKMGSTYIDAIDYDEWSIENASENAKINDCKNIRLIKMDRLTNNKNYDIILANINLQVIMDNLTTIKEIANEDSYILLSGFLQKDEKQLYEVLDKMNMQTVKSMQRNEWICMLVKKSAQ